MKKILLFAISILISSLSFGQALVSSGKVVKNTAPTNSKDRDLTELTYFDGTDFGGVGFGDGTPIQASAISVWPASTLSAHAGESVVRIDVAINNNGSSGTVNSLKVCIWTDTTGTTAPVYEQEVSNFIDATEGWNEVLLTTPYPITGTEELFIGYSIDGVGFPLSTEQPANNETNGYGDVMKIPDMVHLSAFDIGDLAIKVQVGDPIELDANLRSVNVGDFIGLGEHNIKGKLSNSGMNPITSYDVTYKLNETELPVYSVSDVNIAAGETVEFTHNVNFTDTGMCTFEVKISNINGGDDDNSVNNVLTKEIHVLEKLRPVVLEQFTTENCPNCPPVLKAVEAQLEEAGCSIILITHHAGYYTDFLTNSTAETQASEFVDAGVPAGMYDRHYNGKDNDNYQGIDPTPTFYNGNPFGKIKYEERLFTPEKASVNINGTNENGELAITVSGNFLEDITHEVGVSLWITEDSILGTQTGGGSNWMHRYSQRAVVSERLGDPITTGTNTGDTYTATYNTTLNSSWNTDQIYLVAFVGNINSSDVNDREILAAKQVKLTNLSEDANKEIVKNASIKIYPNPATDYVKVNTPKNSTIQIYNILGNLVYSEKASQNNTNINVSGLKAGTYILKVVDAKATRTTKFNVVK